MKFIFTALGVVLFTILSPLIAGFALISFPVYFFKHRKSNHREMQSINHNRVGRLNQFKDAFPLAGNRKNRRSK